MRQEAEVYKQQLELERLKQELISLRGNPNKPLLPQIGMEGYPRNISPNHESKKTVSSFSSTFISETVVQTQDITYDENLFLVNLQV